jgi:hypothetical protein
MSDSEKITTPAGPAVRLMWPSGGGHNFTEISGTGFDQVTDNRVNVTPVLLDTGEVRFYSEDALL